MMVEEIVDTVFDDIFSHVVATGIYQQLYKACQIPVGERLAVQLINHGLYIIAIQLLESKFQFRIKSIVSVILQYPLAYIIAAAFIARYKAK